MTLILYQTARRVKTPLSRAFRLAYNGAMRFMGIDFGTKRVGVAVSDEGNTVAFPKAVLSNDGGLVSAVGAIAREAGVTSVVLGESKDFDGVYNPVMKGAFEFKRAIEGELGLSVELEPEFMTSAHASRQGDTPMLDASAAALILQSYLDKRNNTNDDNDR